MSTTENMANFHSVDRATDPTFFAQFMDKSHTLQAARIYKQSMFEQLHLQKGEAVLDVGCGTGQDALDLAYMVGPSGRVAGIDLSETMLNEARARAAGTEFSIEFMLADATHLPFANESFDACQAARLFEHLQKPEMVLAEMVRVARPGARIVVADADFDLTIVDIPDRALARKLIHIVCDQMTQGWMGRQLPRFLQQAGLDDITVEGYVLPCDYAFFQMVFGGALQQARDKGAISPEELTRFWQALEQAEQEQHFFAGVVGFIASGRKPQ